VVAVTRIDMTAKISVGTSAFTMGTYAENPIPFEQVVMRLAELGYDGLEIPAIDGYGSLQDYPDSASRQKLTKLVRSAGLEISSYGADLSPSPFFSAEPDIRADARILFTRAIEFCLDCEIQVIRVDTLAEPPHPPGVGFEQAWQRTVESFRYYAEDAQRHGIVVAWEFEPGFMFNKPSEIVGLVKEVDHPNFTVMFDACHAHMCAAIGARQEPPREILPGGAVELGKQLHGHIGFVHLIDSDNTLHDGITSTHAPFGTGVLDLPRLVQTMLDAGYQNPWWTIDLCFWPNAWQELEPSLNYVQNILKDFYLR
jgi:sugar phosphate isomerase/epimerase